MLNRKEYDKQYYIKNKEKRDRQKKEWYIANRTKVLEQKAIYGKQRLVG